MKYCLSFVALFLTVGLVAAEKHPFDFHSKPKDEAEKQARKAYVAEMMLKRTGGIVTRPGSQRGEIVYVNCQSAVGDHIIQDRISYLAKETKFKIALKKGVFDIAKPKIEGSTSIFIVDDEKLPSLLVAPESRWAMVNIAPLKTDKVAFFEARVKKELVRAFAYACGGANSKYPNAVTGGIANVSDLDKIAEQRLPVDVFSRMASYMVVFGVTPASTCSYRKACTEGWAASPTNSYQKAVWDEVHKMPTTPIVIKPETKK